MRPFGYAAWMSQGRKPPRFSSWISCRRNKQLDVVPEASQFADHLARAYLLGLSADGRTTFLIGGSAGGESSKSDGTVGE